MKATTFKTLGLILVIFLALKFWQITLVILLLVLVLGFLAVMNLPKIQEFIDDFF